MVTMGTKAIDISGMPCRTSPPWWRKIGISAVPAITSRAATLAGAAAVRSSPTPKIRIGSSTALTSAPQMVAIIARRASPYARKIAPPTMPTIRNGRLGTMICR